MKANRHQRRASERVTPAKSPRRPAPAIRAGIAGTTGRAVSGCPDNPVRGRIGDSDGARRPAGNTMRNARMGGQGISYYDPQELARESLTRTNVNAPARVSNRAYDATTYQNTLAAAEAAGLRERAMARHSILTTTGAINVQPRTGPVWLNDSSN